VIDHGRARWSPSLRPRPLCDQTRGRGRWRPECDAALTEADFSPAYLRDATAYGHSSMLRIDLVSNLLGCAVAKGDIRIISDGTPWCPLIHCRDVARALLAFLEATREVTHNQR
jgi:nucleoside-diphosphate-sugar epimerase